MWVPVTSDTIFFFDSYHIYLCIVFASSHLAIVEIYNKPNLPVLFRVTDSSPRYYVNVLFMSLN